jgi:hypothetical protein
VRSLLASFFLLGVCCYGQTRSALESDPSGWVDIMPDASLKGWTRLPFMTPGPVSSVQQWKVDPKEKILLCEGDGGHDWLRYDKELTNVIFHAEFRFTKIENGRGYNSGVMIRNNADGSIYHQAQAGDVGTGWLFGTIPNAQGQPQRYNLRNSMGESRVKPVGEWNVYEVRAEGPKLTLWVNGYITGEQPESGSSKGFVGLEGEGYRIEFRNIKIKELK